LDIAEHEGELRHESLDTFTRQFFDVELVHMLMMEVVEHYSIDVAFLAMEAVDKLHLCARFGIKSKVASMDSIARHHISRALPIIVEDTHKCDWLLADPFVSGELGIRFFVNVPLLISAGRCVGSLCIMHTMPRDKFTLDESACVTSIASKIMDLLLRSLA